MFKNKKGFVNIVVVVLLLFISILIFWYIYKWYIVYESGFEVELAQKELSQNLEVLKVRKNFLYVQNDYSDNLNIEYVKIGDHTCGVTNTVINKGEQVINIGSCTYQLNEMQPYDVLLGTNIGVLQNIELVKEPLPNPLEIIFTTSICNFAEGYVNLYGLSDLENAHVVNNSYYHACAKHYDYTLGTSSAGGNFANLFYITELNNSAVWTNKTDIYEAPAQWYNVTISSSGGNISYAINSSDMSSLGYVCAGKIDEDNVYGSHIGNCASSMPDTIWVRII